MKFAKIVFWIAGIWGVLVLTPLFFMFNVISRNDPPAITHPGFYYGFAGVALVWQIAFIIIATDPIRLRPMMIPSILEKVAYSATVLTLFLQGRMHSQDLVLFGTDFLLAILFLIAFFKTAKPAANHE